MAEQSPLAVALQARLKKDKERTFPELVKELAAGFYNNPRNAETVDALFGGASLAPGIGDAASALEAKYRFDQGDMLGAGLAGVGALPLVPSMAGVIKAKGGNWLPEGVDRTIDSLKLRTLQRLPEEHIRHMEAIPPARRGTEYSARFAEQQQKAALNQWLDTALRKYITRDMATPEDPIRALAEQNILHAQPEALNFRPEMWGHEFNPNQTWMGKSDLAKAWEGVSDNTIDMGRAGRTAPHSPDLPWMAKLPPDTPVYGILEGQFAASDLGFDHVRDILQQDLASGALRPENLQRLSMADAVRRTHAANLAAARKMQQARLASMEGLPMVKEYPDSGMRWVELKSSKGKEATAEALKQEGDSMGHCVGGYCDEVEAGQSRIFSLRDAKGEPHVTIEVDPGASGKPGAMPQIRQIKGKQNAKPKDEYLPFVQDFVKTQGKWSEVGDLRNSGLRQAFGGYYTENELRSAVESVVGSYNTQYVLDYPQDTDPNTIKAIQNALQR